MLAVTGLASTAHAGPKLTLDAGHVQGSLTIETDTSSHKVGDTVSVAPDISVGVTDDVTISVIHSTFGRTGFRGAAGGGFCTTDPGCARTYDNVGVEALYSLVRGPAAVAVDAGVYATSFDHHFYVAKLGAKARYVTGPVTLATLPSVTLAATERDAMTPNRDRLWVPASATVAVADGLGLGLATGLKAPLDGTFTDSYEIALGALATYTYSPQLAFGASWIEGKLLAGSTARPAGMDAMDSRALQVWVTGTY